MENVDWNSVLVAVGMLVGAVAAWAGSYAAARTEFRHLWRELGRVDGRAEKSHSRMDDHEREFHRQRRN